ncbi:MAG: hypothetical protein JWQ40_4110 [Segetibacter sp.]|nr:hypothetical protein [Segetibacter sp.]
MEDKNLSTVKDDYSKALTPAELIRKHNADPKHVITADEIKNLKVGKEAEDEKELNREIDDKEAEDNCRHHENNIYDILDA